MRINSYLGSKPHKVAAVCYRNRGNSIKFLLVKTKSGKWTFPKGNVEPHLSLSESAQLEAYEEAGAMGAVASTHFDSYLHEKRFLENGTRALVVAAFLLAVEQTIPPMEDHRNPMWFSPREAKSRLSQRRSRRLSREFSRVIDNAVSVLYPRGIQAKRPEKSQTLLYSRQ